MVKKSRTTSSRTRATKTASRKKTSKAAAPSLAKTIVVKPEEKPEAAIEELRKKELVAQLVELTGQKPRDIRPVLEATLRVLGQSVTDGRGFSLPPFGKLRVVKSVDGAKAEVATCKVRRAKDLPSPETPGKE